MHILEVSWLAGLLEGEGWFGTTTQRGRRTPAVQVEMTDRDVVERAASLMGVGVMDRAQRNPLHSQCFMARVSGNRAADLMTILAGELGHRRSERISGVLSDWASRPDSTPKLTATTIAEILEARSSSSYSQRAMAERHGVSRLTIRRIQREQGFARNDAPTRSSLFSVIGPATCRDRQVAWLAGLLEGEGSFMHPAPSRPRSPVVSLSMTDQDVVERAASILGVSACRTAPRSSTGRAVWCVQARGRRAVATMMAVDPYMGERRSLRIEEVLAACPMTGPRRKVSRSQAEEIAARMRRGHSAQSLAREFSLSVRRVYELARPGALATEPAPITIGHEGDEQSHTMGPPVNRPSF